MSQSFKDIKRGMKSRLPQSGAPRIEPERAKPVQQVPESMMKGITRESIFSQRFLFKDWVKLVQKRRKGLFKKKVLSHLYMRLEAKNFVLAFYANENKDAPPIKRFYVEDCTYKIKDTKEFMLELHANDYKNQDVKKKLKIKFKDNTQFYDFLKVLKHIKLEELVDKKSLKKKNSKKNIKRRVSNTKISKGRKEGQLNDDEFGINMTLKETHSFKKNVANWNTNDVLNWSKHVILGKNYDKTLHEIASQTIAKKKLDGRLIINLKREEIQEVMTSLGVNEFKDRTLLKKEIIQLQKNKVFDTVRAVVVRKVVKMLEKTGKKSSLLITKFASNFGNPLFMINNMLKILYANNEENLEKQMIFRIKLIIVENMREDRMKRIRKMLGGLIALKDSLSDNKNTKYGLFHAAISIGGLQLEWVDTSLVIVRPVSSEKVLLCVDVANIEVENGHEFCEKLAHFCLKWNREFEYEALNLKKSRKYANCQEFVVMLLQYLEIQYSFSKHVNYYLDKRLKLKGTCEMVFDYDKKFAKKFHLKSKKNHFKPSTHKEHDKFVNELFRISPSFKIKHESEYSLLKGFDRAFWMKNMKYSGAQPNFRPAKADPNDFFSGCPFCERDDNEGNYKDDDEVKTVTIHLKKRPNISELLSKVKHSDNLEPPSSFELERKGFNVKSSSSKKNIIESEKVENFINEELEDDFNEDDVLKKLEEGYHDDFE